MKKSKPLVAEPQMADILKKETSGKHRFWLFSALLILIYTFTASYTFNPRIQIYGDNTSYYILSKALAAGEGYTEIHHLDKAKHHHYPPGYPAFMSLVMRVGGDSVLIQKYANVVVLGLGLLLLFWIACQITDQPILAFVACVYVSLNPSLLQFSSAMMSEVLFFTFSMGTLLLFLRWKNRPLLVILICLVILMAATYYVRSLGLALAVAIVGTMILSKSWKASLISGIGFVALLLPWQLRNASESSYINQLMLKNPYQKQLGHMEGSDWFVRIWENLQRYITREIPDSFFRFVKDTDLGTPGFAEWLLGVLLLILLVYGLYKTPRYRLVMSLYLLATAGILLLWPQAWFGVRFVLPVVPLMILYCFLGIYHGLDYIFSALGNKKMLPARIMLIFLLFAPLLYVSHLRNLRKESILPFSNNYQHYFSMAAWIRKNAPEETVVVCRKQSHFYVYADRFVTGFPRTKDHSAMLKRFTDDRVNYIVVDALGYSDVVEYLVPVLQQNPNYFEVVLVYENPNSYLVRFHPKGDFRSPPSR